MPKSKEGMVNLRVNRDDEDSEAPVTIDNEFPWGLRIHLEDEILVKMGIDLDKVEIDQEIGVYAFGKIVSKSESSSQNSKDNKNLGIQFTDMRLEGIKKRLSARSSDDDGRFDVMDD